MKRIVFGSLQPAAGKTSLLLGYARARDGSAGYMKPFGDRPHYKKKRLWDSDASLLTRSLGLEENPEIISLGFDHSKIRFTYPGDELVKRLREAAEASEAGKSDLLIEAGATLASGASLGLDAANLARVLEAKLYVVLAGDPDAMADGAHFLARQPFVGEPYFGGIILNRISDPDEFARHHRPAIDSAGLPVAGVVPRDDAVCALTTAYLADELFVKVLAGEPRTEPAIDGVFLGVVPASAAREDAAFHSTSKLVVTEGGRSDLIVAALESGAAGIVLANDISPEPQIVALAREKDVPLMLASRGLIDIARRIDALKPVPSFRDTERQNRLSELVSKNVTL